LRFPRFFAANRPVPEFRSQAPGLRFQLLPWFQASLIAGAAVLIYSPVFRGSWLWDDFEILGDGNVRSWGGLFRLWVSPAAADYSPVKSLAFWIQWHLWGDNLLGFHLVNVALHVAAACLIWRVLAKLGVPLAWLGGLLFAVHPVAVESVAWVSEQKNTLSLCLLLLACCAWIEGHARCSWLWFVAAFLCKASVVMFPALLLAHAWWSRPRIDRALIRALVPFFAVSLALGAVTVWFQLDRAISHWSLPREDLASRLTHAGLALEFYLSKCLFPRGMMPIYPGWPAHPNPILVALPWVGLATVVFGLFHCRKIPGFCRATLLALGWFVLNLVPVLGFIPMSYQHVAPVADHFCYLSLVGVTGLVAAGLGSILRVGPRSRRVFEPVFGLVLAAGVLALAVESRRYAAVFVDQETMWAYNLGRNPTSRAVSLNEGYILHHDGRIPEAIRMYEQAIRLDPDDAQAEDDLANIYAEQSLREQAAEHFEKAIAHYRRALELDPGLTATRSALAKTLANAGRPLEAAEQYEKLLREHPDDAETENNFGKALGELGRPSEALAHFRAALRIDPDFAEAENSLGYALATGGDPWAGMAHLARALRLRPDFAEAENNLGYVLAGLGRQADAIPHFEAALRLRPGFGQAHNNLGFALAALGRRPEAMAEFEQALRLAPADPKAHFNLGILLGMAGRRGEAISHLETALRLKPDFPQAAGALRQLQALGRAAAP
jgi:tetratricopeptide (TPR) repeat protein